MKVSLILALCDWLKIREPRYRRISVQRELYYRGNAAGGMRGAVPRKKQSRPQKSALALCVWRILTIEKSRFIFFSLVVTKGSAMFVIEWLGPCEADGPRILDRVTGRVLGRDPGRGHARAVAERPADVRRQVPAVILPRARE